MKIIKQAAYLLDTTGMTQYQVIEKAGRTCYKSENKITEDSAAKFVASLVKSGHDAMIEFGYLYMKITDIDFLEFFQATRPHFIHMVGNYAVGNFRAFYDWYKEWLDGKWMIDADYYDGFMDLIWCLAQKYPEVYKDLYDKLHEKFEPDVIDIERMNVDEVKNPFMFFTKEELIADYRASGNFDKYLVDIIPHIVMFTTNRGCYDDKTRVLTDKGWKFFDDVDIDNDLICTIDECENLKYVKAKNKIKYFYKGDMHRYKSSQIDLLVTPDHRMWTSPLDIRRRNPDGSRIWSFIPSDQMTSKRYLFSKSSNGKPNDSKLNKLIIEPTVRKTNVGCRKFEGHVFEGIEIDYFLELIGIWITDGSISYGKNGRGNRISIIQVKENTRNEIFYLTSLLGIKTSVFGNDIRLLSPALFDWIVKNFIKDDDCRKTYYLSLPRWIMTDLSRYQIDCLLRGIFLGDGSRHSIRPGESYNRGFVIYTASKQFADDLVELSLLTGRSANVRIVPPRVRHFPSGYVSHCKEQYVVSFSYSCFSKKHLLCTNRSINSGKFDEQYEGFVYCLELESDHRLFVMRNGKAAWCGNCSHELVRHRNDETFAMESTRYCKYDVEKFGGELTIIEPMAEIRDNPEAYERWLKDTKADEESYMWFVKHGISAQAARGRLPHDIKADIWNASFESQWQHKLNLRMHGTTGAPHPQFKELMELVYPQLVEASEGRLK